MSYQIALIPVDQSIIKEKKRKEKDAKLLRRYQFFSMLNDQYSIKVVAGLLNVNIDTITDLIKIDNIEGLAGLGLLKFEGELSSALDSIKKQIVGYLQNENITTLSELQMTIEKKYQLKIEQS